MKFPRLARPPIAEVVCGVMFTPIPELDPLVLGIYWNERKQDFPKRALLPAISDKLSFTVGAIPMRVILTSDDDQFVIQLQHDRFVMNWRAKNSAYPHFSRTGGLYERALAEFQRFCGFVVGQTGLTPVPQRVELAKIDLLQRGIAWSDFDDLNSLMAVTGVFSNIRGLECPEVNLRFVEKSDEDITQVHVATLMQDETPTGVRIEARRIASPKIDIPTAFRDANDVLNGIFFRLIPSAAERFGRKEEQ
jgi:uncharacterized protein (TIGR04255 family)